MSKPQEVIQDIRQKLVQEGNDHLRGMLHRALQQLSEDLYSADSHFILELIQNADDNRYRRGDDPKLRFLVRPKSILLQNNESGFEERNVRALCDIKKSTKTKKHGYIGEKGIGFKSVFQVSDQPHIFSNGFRFKFYHRDPRHGLGFVVPEWVDNTPEEVDPDATNILLPLKADAQHLIEEFDSLDPTMLLFLRKLRRIDIAYPERNTGWSVSRHDLQDQRIELSREECTGDGESRRFSTERFIVHRSQRRRPSDLHEEKRQQIDTTELVLAFPLTELGEPKGLPQQTTFAFLPIRGYGLRFIVHADFLLAANREELHKSRPWNRWLRDQIANVFVEAMDQFKLDDALRHTWYRYIPRPNEVIDPFFEEAVDQLFEALRNHPCLQAQSGTWLPPERVLRPDAAAQRLIPNNVLRRRTGCEYLSSEAELEDDDELLEQLGCRWFAFEDLLECLKDEGWVRKRPDRWFVKLYRYLGDLELDEDETDQVRELNLFRLESGELVSLAEEAIFLPLQRDIRYGFETDLRVLKAASVDDSKVGSAVSALGQLGVSRPDPAAIVNEHILPLYESDDWMSKDQGVLQGHLAYIKDHWKKYPQATSKNSREGAARLRKNILLRTQSTDDDKVIYAHPSELYLSRHYDGGALEACFQDLPKETLLHETYLPAAEPSDSAEDRGEEDDPAESSVTGNAESWRRFMIQLGVYAAPRIISHEGYGAGGERERLPTTAEAHGYHYSDWRFADEVDEAIEQNDPETNERLVRIIDRHWTSTYRGCAEKEVCGSYYGSTRCARYPASFVRTLRNLRVPTTQGPCRLEDVYLRTKQLEETFGDTLPYLNSGLNASDFCRAVGVRTEPDAEMALALLNRMADEPSDNHELAGKLYQLLSTKMNGGSERDIREAFEEDPLILIPDDPPRYVGSADCCWHDYSRILSGARAYLKPHYPNLYQFFVHEIGVREKLDVDALGEALRRISQCEITEEDERVVLAIYEELSRRISKRTDRDEDHPERRDLEELVGEEVFWTNHREFWWNEGDVFLDDDPKLYKLFKDREAIAFLNVPREKLPKIESLCAFARIPRISEAVHRELLNERQEARRDERMTNRLRRHILDVARYLYHKDYEHYQALYRNDAWSRAGELSVELVRNLTLSYSVNDERVEADDRVVRIGSRILVDQQCGPDPDLIASAYAELFDADDELENFVDLLMDRQRSRIDDWFEKRNIHPLSDEEHEKLVATLGGEEHAPEEDALLAMAPAEGSAEGGDASSTDAANHSHRGGGGQPKTSSNPQEATDEYESEEHGIAGARPTGLEPIGWAENGGALPDGVVSPPEDWRPEVEPGEAEDAENVEVRAHRRRAPRKVRDDPPPTGVAEEFTEAAEHPDEMSAADKNNIARWGEEWLVRRHLRERFARQHPNASFVPNHDGFEVFESGQPIGRVRWMNQHGDKRCPYDIYLIDEGLEEFVEVKSTHHAGIAWLQITRQQWQFAREKGEQYRVYRVMNAGRRSPKLLQIPDPFTRWMLGEIEAHPVRLRV